MSDQGPFGLSGDEYWTAPWKEKDALLERHVMDKEFGLFVDVPPRADLARRPEVPLLLLYAATEREAYCVDVPAQAKVVAARLEDHAVLVGRAMAPVDNRLPEDKVGEDSDAPTSEQYVSDLARQLPLTEGTYLVTVLLRDLVTRRASLVVERKGSGYQDDAVAAFLAERRASRPALTPKPPLGDARVAYRPVRGSPPIPAAPGLALAVERVLVADGRTRVILRGSFRLALLPWEVAPPPGPDEQPDPAAPRPTGVAPITLVVLGSVDPAERVIALQVPCFAPVAPDAPEGSGLFAVDLFAFGVSATLAQTHFVHAFSGAHLASTVVGLVTPDLLPR